VKRVFDASVVMNLNYRSLPRPIASHLLATGTLRRSYGSGASRGLSIDVTLPLPL